MIELSCSKIDFLQVYLLNDRRHNYTTPKSFLELINLYLKILTNKHHELDSKMSRLENGLEKLRVTASQVKQRLSFYPLHCKVKNFFTAVIDYFSYFGTFIVKSQNLFHIDDTFEMRTIGRFQFLYSIDNMERLARVFISNRDKRG
jgi:hypothetical protein